MTETDLTHQGTHFAFGANWAAYAKEITQADIDQARVGLSHLLHGEGLNGKSFLDIGSGSGLHSLAAISLGAAEVVALDIDAESVATTMDVLERCTSAANFRVERMSVFDLAPEALDANPNGRTEDPLPPGTIRAGTSSGRFDVVYSWGVLHHTGDMMRALCCAAGMVAKGGIFVFALYRRIWMDWFWRREKRWYAKASSADQLRAQALFIALFRLGLLVTGRRFDRYVAQYRGKRGMSFYHDVHDWLGGFPYESVSAVEVKRLMERLGFVPVRIFARKGKLFGADLGLFGSGCDEFVYQRA